MTEFIQIGEWLVKLVFTLIYFYLVFRGHQTHLSDDDQDGFLDELFWITGFYIIVMSFI